MVPSARKLSRFWALLLLAAVIATAGVVTDSTATVIGAMIVAPLMTPILGMVLSTVTADPRNLGVSFLLVATGACAVVALGWLPRHHVRRVPDVDSKTASGAELQHAAGVAAGRLSCPESSQGC